MSSFGFQPVTERLSPTERKAPRRILEIRADPTNLG